MMAKTQIQLRVEDHRRAREKAAALGISLSEYLRRLVAKDMAAPEQVSGAEAVFDLGDSRGSDVARYEDDYLAQAFVPRSGQDRPYPTRATKRRVGHGRVGLSSPRSSEKEGKARGKRR